jgi:predicted DNA-binding protein (MmcQ/YjbR family)
MNVEELREYALRLGKVTEGFPFGNDTLVFKVDNKIFLLVSLSADHLQFNVKCNPEDAVELRETYSSILPGYHMNKKHWNTIIVDGSLTAPQIKGFIRDSYRLVAPKK